MSRIDEVKAKIKKCDDKTLLGGIAMYNIVIMDVEIRKQVQSIIQLAIDELELRSKNGTRTD